MQQVRDDTMQDRLAGVVLGTAVGDSIGLPAEGLSPRRRQRLLPGPWRQPLAPVRYFWPAVLPRNLLFLAVVLLHGFRRLAPPY